MWPKQNKKQPVSELSRYRVRILSETKPSGRTRKCPITLCLGEKFSFYFIKISLRFPTLIIIYPLGALFYSHFSPLWRLRACVWATEDFIFFWKRSKEMYTFPESWLWTRIAALENLKLPIRANTVVQHRTVREDRQQFLVLTLSTE